MSTWDGASPYSPVGIHGHGDGCIPPRKPDSQPGERPARGPSPGLTGVQLEHQLDGVVVEVAAVLDDLDEGGQAALHRRHLRDRHRGVELPENCRVERGEAPAPCLLSCPAPGDPA